MKRQLELAPQVLLLCTLAHGLEVATEPPLGAQAVKGTVEASAPPPPLTYHGLIPGLDTGAKVRETLGEPVFEAPWYDYKLYYPVADRPGLYDVVHVDHERPDARLANVDAASVPAGYETEPAIRERLGRPEYELRMATFGMLDYSEAGLRFAVDPSGRTIGVAYFPHGRRRVPGGERRVMDLSHLRQGPQPAPAQPAELGSLRAGTAEVVISPQGDDWLGHPFRIHDDLRARTVVWSQAETTVALIGADLFGMGRDELQVVREAARELGVEHTIVAMSHDHAAPDTIGVYGHYPAEYNAWIQGQLIESVRRALADRRPVGSFRTVSTELPMDGMRVQDLFRNARNPGVLDPQIAVLQARDPNGSPIVTLVHFACHVESLAKGPREISADFPGTLCDKIREDGGGQCVFLNGALGGMVSGDNRERTQASAREMGLALAEIVRKLLPLAQPGATFELRATNRTVEIPMTNPNFQPLFESGLRSLHRGRVVTDLTYLRLGEADLVTLPGELLPEVSFEILEKMEGYPRLLVGLGNDQLGYMIPPYDFRDDAYEETMSQGPAAAVQVRDAALRMLAGVD